MTKTITIGTRIFRIDRKAIGHTYTGECTLDQVYRNPSAVKRYHWQGWLYWADQVGAKICVESANSQIYTISGLVTVDGVPYYLYITPTYWRVYPM